MDQTFIRNKILLLRGKVSRVVDHKVRQKKMKTLMVCLLGICSALIPVEK